MFRSDQTIIGQLSQNFQKGTKYSVDYICAIFRLILNVLWRQLTETCSHAWI